MSLAGLLPRIRSLTWLTAFCAAPLLATSLAASPAAAQDGAAAPARAPRPPASKPPPAAVLPATPQDAADQLAEEILKRSQAQPFPGSAPRVDGTQPSEARPAQLENPFAALKQVLAPLGQWIDDPLHGTVWIPKEAQSSAFAPYLSDGSWSVDQDGRWTWMSERPWSPIAYRFGNWTWLSQRRSWAWVPDDRHAPAHVIWRIGEIAHRGRTSPFVGWAPVPPSHRWMDGEREPLSATSRTLAFFYVPADAVFSRDVSARTVTDPALGAAVQAGSELREASPSFADAKLALGAVPRARVLQAEQTLDQAVLELAQRQGWSPPTRAATAAAAEPPAASPSPPDTARDRRALRDRHRHRPRTLKHCVRTPRGRLRCWPVRGSR